MTITSIKPYTPNGSRLVSKFRKDLAEIIKVETNFGKGLTTITTTFDSYGNLLKRVIEKRGSKKPVEKIVYTYDGIYSVRRKTTIEKFINKRRIQKTTKSEVLQNIKGRNFLTRIVSQFSYLKDKSRHEIQTIEELSAQKHRRYIKTSAKRLQNRELTNKTIEGNVKHLEKFAKSPYFYLRGYSLKDFLISIIPYAKKLQKVSTKEIQVRFGVLEKEVAASTQSHDRKGSVTFDMSKLQSLSGVIDTVNHELRHQYQISIIEKFEAKGFRGFLRKIFKPFQYQYAKRSEREFENYIHVSKNREKYLNQFIERDARNAGYNARSEFLKESGLLDEIFPHSYELFTGNEEFFKVMTRVKKPVNTNFVHK